MAIQKRPYELSVWVEKLNGSNSKIEEKGVIIGAHDMSYLGKATNIVLKRELKGTNTLTFQMPDKYFDSLKGDYVRNEFIDVIYPECKLKLFYDNQWFEFFVKKVDEKKQFKSYMKSYTCTDAFIDELSRNGYGITFDTDLYNNVEEAGTFTETVLEDSIWHYHPEHNWGDFSEFKEEKLYKIPVSQFGGKISGYKLWFELTNKQKETLEIDEISNVYTKEARDVELSDDAARTMFWDQQNLDSPDGEIENPLTSRYVDDIDADGYIYVPYSCLNFCYGSKKGPTDENDEPLKYDRAATETALTFGEDNNIALAPNSVDPRTLIQFLAIPKNAVIELDDGGVILNKDFHYFMTLEQWNNMISSNTWYFFEDTRLVPAEVLGASDLAKAEISHTYRYLYEDEDNSVIHSYRESFGNKVVYYEGYLSDVNDTSIIKGRKYSITDRTELNISDEVDQYTTVYNNYGNEFYSEQDEENLFMNEDWEYEPGVDLGMDNNSYRICSKLATRQIIPQLARNLIQNGTHIQSTDGWAPMHYLEEKSAEASSASISLRSLSSSSGVQDGNEATITDIQGTILYYCPPYKAAAYKWKKPESDSSLGNAYPEYLVSKGSKFYYPKNSDNEYELFTIDSVDNETVWKNCKRGYEKIDTDYIDYIWANESNILQWSFTDEEKKTPPIKLSDEDCSLVNFGIIGQEKNIEKDKIYCLGIKGASQQAIQIRLGTGSLVTDGNYVLSGDYLKFEDFSEYLISADIPWTTLLEGKESVNISDDKFKAVYILFRSTKTIENPYFVLYSRGQVVISSIELFEAYTKGRDNFSTAKYYRYSGRDLFGNEQPLIKSGQSEMNPEEKEREPILDSTPWEKKGVKKIEEEVEEMKEVEEVEEGNEEENERLIAYYSSKLFKNEGWDIYDDKGVKVLYTFNPIENLRERIIFEDDIMLGSTYGYQQYYIQRLVASRKVDDKTDEIDSHAYDTFAQKEFISSNIASDSTDWPVALPLDAAQFSEDNYVIETNYINMNKCKYYVQNVAYDKCDCSYGSTTDNPVHTCFYQKFGYCPYRFQTEKHPRRIRTLSVSKSNRFNIIQEISKVFEFYPQFYITHKSNGKVIQNDGEYDKEVFYITEKGMENKVGFRYEKNLKDISRSIDSNSIVTKLYVQDVDSDLSKTGLCSIKTAEDNPSKDSFIIDLSYYIQKGMLEEEEVTQDLYGVTSINEDLVDSNTVPQGFLRQLGYYNTRYDELTNNIINLQDSSYNELEANLVVNLEGIITAQEQLLKIKGQMERFMTVDGAKDSQSYVNYQTKYNEQEAILMQLVSDTFFTNGNAAKKEDSTSLKEQLYREEYGTDGKVATEDFSNPALWFNCITDYNKMKEYWVDQHLYTQGILGQFNKEYKQIEGWKKERASYLKLINRISTAFYKKYEPYLKEGTWTDSNYLTDNAYYFGALDVAAEGAIPKVTYTISVVALGIFDDIYNIYLADTSFVEDIGMFGINKKTGLPNQLKILVDSLTYNLDDASKDTISVRNYTTAFNDLFQQVTASVQSLTYNENIYKRSANFTSLQNVGKSSLQGTLDSNDLTYLDTDESNIQLDNTGTRGSDINNHANKYKLDGQGLYFSNDGGEHWSVGVGPKGINADYIKVGTLDAGKIRIADSNYIYFSWDKDGIVAYRDPMSINTDSQNAMDFAEFNKYGLTIAENGNIRLRAGYSFTGDINGPDAGKLSTETELGEDVGFYLYDNNGQTIFSTNTASAIGNKGTKDTAILSLIGEMIVTNEATQSNTSKTTVTYSNQWNYTDGKLIKSIGSPIVQVSDLNVEKEEGNIPTLNINTQSDLTAIRAADCCFIEDKSLEKIKIIDSIDNTEYEIEKVSIKENGGYYIKTDDKGLQECLIYTVAIKYNEQENSQEFYKINNAYYINSTQFSLIKVSNIDPVGVTDGISVSYWKVGDNLESNVNLYYNANNYYQDREVSTKTETQTTGPVGLLLNNAGVNDNDGQSDLLLGSERLFVTCIKTNDVISNLFTVLKDGTVYFSGDINDSANDQKLIPTMSEKITITNEAMRVQKDGLYINFDNIKNIDGSGSLTKYIADTLQEEINNASGELYNTIIEIINQRVGDLDSDTSRKIKELWEAYNGIDQSSPGLASHRITTTNDIIHGGFDMGGTLVSYSEVLNKFVDERFPAYVTITGSSSYIKRNIYFKDLIESLLKTM